MGLLDDRVAVITGAGRGIGRASALTFVREGARVMLTASAGMNVQEIYVDMTGMYRFTEVPRGSYYVSASAYGYEEARELVQVGAGPVGGIFLYLRPKPSAALPVQIEPLDVDQRLIPKDARKAFERGVSELRRGKFPEALAQLDRAVELYPKYATAWHTKGLVHLQLGEIDSARSSFETALQFNPRSGLAHFEISRTYWALGDVDNCEKHIIEAHELNPRIPQVHMVRANVFLARGDYQKALKELDEFLEFVPGVVPEGQLAAYVRHQRAQIVARLDTTSPQ